MKSTASTLGTSIPRVDAYDKVTGRAMYTADLIAPNALVARVLHATIANGLVRSIDTQKASRIPGIVKIVTCFDVPQIPFATPGNPWTLRQDLQDVADRLLLNRRVRYYGDDIAAVVAEDEFAAQQALSLIQVEYEIYPPVFDAFAAQTSSPPIHAECADNILGQNQMQQGEFHRAISESGLTVVDKWYRVPAVKHCHMENPVSYAYVQGGKIVVVSATQMAHVLRRILGQALGLPWGQFRVIKPWVGGGFGNKDDALYEPLNAFLCLQVGGRCVKLELSREEDFANTRVRHAMAFHLTSYLRKDGSIAARQLETVSNQGAYASHGHAIAAKGLLDFSMIYRSDAYRCSAKTVYTNTPCAGAMRGYGIPQITFALESHADDCALAIGMPPLEFRRKNMMAVGFSSDDHSLTNYFDSLNQCLDRAANYLRMHPSGQSRQAPKSSCLRRGIGSAIFWYKTGTWPFCLEAVTCRLLLNQDGSFLLHLAECEIGQGADTAFTQLLADQMEVSPDQVRIVSTKDTDHTPFGTGAYASRQTYVCGMAIAETAALMQKKIINHAAFMTHLAASTLSYRQGCVWQDSKRVLTLAQVAMDSFYNMDQAKHLIVEHTTNCHSNALSLGCCMAEVEVDLKLGTVHLLNIVNAHDCGRLINPALAQSQVHGGVSMGIGYALSEQLQLDQETGRLYTDNLLDYKLPTAMDHPEHIGAVFVENAEPTSPFGTKALGEPPVVPVAPAIRNAVLQATGAAIDTLPLNPQNCLAAFAAQHTTGGD